VYIFVQSFDKHEWSPTGEFPWTQPTYDTDPQETGGIKTSERNWPSLNHDDDIRQYLSTWASSEADPSNLTRNAEEGVRARMFWS